MKNKEMGRQIAEIMGVKQVVRWACRGKMCGDKTGFKNEEDAQKELDKYSHLYEKIEKYYHPKSIKQYSTNITHAFEARDKIATMSTSVRIRFARSLVDVISDRVEERISPEMAMLYVLPVDICLAAIEAVKGKDDG